MDTKELEQIIENHRHWLDEDAEGWEAMRANLCGADLSEADLRGANLSGADLSEADLRGANLINANLINANLGEADLRGADLRGANLSGADLRGANLINANLSVVNLRGANLRNGNLSDANLRGSNLRDANLSVVNLRGANLRDTNLSDANMRGVNMRGADLSEADLRGSNLSDAKNVPYIPMICPEEGSFIGYKNASGKIIKLCIPEDAKRSSATTRKCRCNKAVVLAIYELDGSISKATEVASSRDNNFIYKINKEVVVDDFDDDRWNECSTGIHFFMQRHEAVEYQS